MGTNGLEYVSLLVSFDFSSSTYNFCLGTEVVMFVQGDAHVGGEANGYHFENSSGEYSDMLTSVKVEHRTVNSM